VTVVDNFLSGQSLRKIQLRIQGSGSTKMEEDTNIRETKQRMGLIEITEY
jgi:hypothetical protein